MRLEVEKIFDARVDQVFSDRKDLARFFKTHERKPKCIDNLCEEIRTAEWALGAKMNAHKHTELIHTVVGMFCKAAIGTKENELMSASEKARIQIAERELRDLENEITEENSKVNRGQIVGKGYTGKLIAP